MNQLFAQRVHIGAIGALIAVSLINLLFHLGIGYPVGYLGYRVFAVVNALAIAGLLGVRLRQLIVQAIVVDPRPGLERLAVTVGQALIIVGFIGMLVGLAGNFVGGAAIRQLSTYSAAGMWIGLGCIELVIANNRSAVLTPDERPSGTARFFVGLFILLAGFLLGVMAVIGFLFMAMGH